MKLKGKRVLITAGAQGIGEAISRQFIAAGAHIVVHYFSSDKSAKALVDFAHQQGLVAAAVQGDLCRQDAAKRVVKYTIEQLGGLDILINNAGSLIERRTLESADSDFWYKVIDTNISSAQFVTQAAVAALKCNSHSSIVNLASLAGRKGGHPGSLVYSMAKGAILTWTRALANELGPHGVRVNAVAPGLILGTAFHNTHTTQASAEATIEGIPLRCAGTADDVARAVLFLASEYDGFINGATLDINGGAYCA
ncbi:MAG TPA: SDR family oxidoreductase [Marinagarivorans sp.]